MRNAAEKAIAAQEGTQVTAVPSESPDTTEDTNDSTGKVSSVSEQSPPIFYHKDNGCK